MTKLAMYQVDAFSDQLFHGNPAAVCPLANWLPDTLLQAIAQENNLAETAFFVGNGAVFHLRWFTPLREVELCGHATLASAHVLYTHLGYQGAEIHFQTLSGALFVRREGGRLAMEFPADPPRDSAVPEALVQGIGIAPLKVLAAMDYIAVLESAAEVQNLQPDFRTLMGLDRRGVAVTAPGEDCDFVCRFFAPNYGIDEDPVTGSAYCQLAPYWAEKLARHRLTARQLSARGGTVDCELRSDRVVLSGQCVTYLKGEINLPRQ